MTRLLIDPVTDFDDGGTGPVELTATLLDPDPAGVRSFTVTDSSSVVDLDPPGTGDAWRLTVRRGGYILDERTVLWTGSSPTHLHRRR